MTQETTNQTATIVVIGVLLLVLACCLCLNPFSGESEDRAGRSEPARTRGWLCDWDRRGEVALWDAPGLTGRSITAVVPMTMRGCVVAFSLEERMVGGIIFYRVKVDGQLGWVDVDYFYPRRRPSWSQ